MKPITLYQIADDKRWAIPGGAVEVDVPYFDSP
jgi:hypothetical protein